MIIRIQYLRGIAALMVVVFHAFEMLERQTGFGNPFRVGALGVDVFFVISGFIIFVAADKSDAKPFDFMLKRLLRIAPLYWALTLLVAAIALFKPALLASTVFDLRHLVASLLFIPMQHPKLDAIFPVLVPGWTLNYEMAFYFVMASALFAPRVIRPWIVMGVLGAVVALGRLGAPIPVFYADAIILEFALGIAIALVFRSGFRIAAGTGVLLTLTGFALLIWLEPVDLSRFVKAGLPALLIVAGAALGRRDAAKPAWRPLLLLGDASYSLYLTHALVLPVFGKLWVGQGWSMMTGGGFVFIASVAAVSALIGVLCYRLVEKPLLGLTARTHFARKPPIGVMVGQPQ
ncbi:acyltransferase family protein [Aureimonas sp. N4]|uniref:acyltransferase family protein n=1 Tax=Aureimonas sp. N4 TaxID=1638165 RepID=UPI000782D8E9|nr:acyltransferase [Aureimonas sp. N4]